VALGAKEYLLGVGLANADSANDRHDGQDATPTTLMSWICQPQSPSGGFGPISPSIRGGQMPKLQRQFVVNKQYVVTGSSKFTRRLKLAARLRLNGREYLLFQPVRKVDKVRR
jgi:hypothetical protein